MNPIRWFSRTTVEESSGTRLSRERFAGWALAAAVALLTLWVYSLTLARGVCPGEPGVATAQALGLLPSAPPSHPLWLLIARGVARLPLPADAVLRLNAFSALCGSLAAALVFLLVRRILAELYRSSPEGGGQAPDAADAWRRRSVLSATGGLVAAAAFAFSFPAWCAATALHPQTFDILLLLAAADRLACYSVTGRVPAAAAAAFLLGLGLVESAAGWYLAPLAVWLLARRGLGPGRQPHAPLLVASGLAGAAVNAGLLVGLSNLSFAQAADQVRPLLAGAVGGLWSDLSASLPRPGWTLVTFQTLAPLLAATVSLSNLPPPQDGAARKRWMAANLLFTVFVAAGLAGGPYAPWALTSDSGRLSILPSLTLAAAAGALAAFWCALATARPLGREAGRSGSAAGARLLGFALCGLLACVSLNALRQNARLADGRPGDFADRVADAVLAEAGPARCLLVDGLIDMNLLVRNRLSAQPRTILLARPGSPHAARSRDFLVRWLRANPGLQSQVASVAEPQLWRDAGLTPVPRGLVYTGSAGAGALACDSLVSVNRAFWSRVSPLLADEPGARPSFARLRARVRERLSRAANDLGEVAEQLGAERAADQAYARALGFSANNTSACLNRYCLRLRLAKPMDGAAIAGRLYAQISPAGAGEAAPPTSSATGRLPPLSVGAGLPELLRGRAAFERTASTPR